MQRRSGLSCGHHGGRLALWLGCTAAVVAGLSGCGSGSSRHRAPVPRHRRPAAAASTIAINATVTPPRAGSSTHPRGVRLALAVAFAGASPVREISVAFPAGNLYRGGSYPACGVAVLERDGPGGCPTRSVMGAGTATAEAAGVTVKAPLVVINGGAHRVLLYITANNPVALQVVAIGSITRNAGSSSYRLTLHVPAELQQIAGAPVLLRRVALIAGRGDWLATDACLGGAWHYTARATLANGGNASGSATIPCR